MKTLAASTCIRNVYAGAFVGLAPQRMTATADMRQTERGILASVSRSVLLLIVVLAINGFAFSYLSIYIAAYLPQLGVSASTVGLIIGAEGLSMAVFAIPFLRGCSTFDQNHV
jgi:hypothetical protein